MPSPSKSPAAIASPRLSAANTPVTTRAGIADKPRALPGNRLHAPTYEAPATLTRGAPTATSSKPAPSRSASGAAAPASGVPRGPTTKLQVASVARQNHRPDGSASGTRSELPAASSVRHMAVIARSRQSVTRAPSAPAPSAQRSVGRAPTTLALSGATRRGAPGGRQAPVLRS